MLINDPVIPAPASEARRTATSAQSSTVFIRLIADGACIIVKNLQMKVLIARPLKRTCSRMMSVRIPPGIMRLQ